jgi:phage shock protein PspC (stress-responsive transcriptional regulator)/predicted membrane protein
MTETTASTPTPSSEPRKLHRSDDDKMIAGVAGGIGEYFGIDPVLVRLGFVGLALLGGAGLVLYPVAWALVPDADGSARGLREVLRFAALVVGALVLVGGLFLAAAVAVGFGGGTAVAIAVLVAGIGIFIAAFGGGKLRWLIVPAFAVALGATAVAATDVDLHGGFKDKRLAPTSARELQSEYRLGAGRLEVNLTAMRFPPGDTRVNARIGIGELRVIVPNGVCVATDSKVNAGRILWFGDETSGTGVDRRINASQRGAPRLVLHGRVGVGSIEINENGIPGVHEACMGAKREIPTR